MSVGSERMGFLLVDKPAGITSHAVVARVRSALGVRKTGHAGTLDPFATGLLVLGVGRATRLLEYLVGLDKEYECEALLGVATDSLDPEGRIVARDDRWRSITAERIGRAAASLEGTCLQTPPALSAVKVRGVPAHRRVRRGEQVQLAPREVDVRRFELAGTDLPAVRFRVACSSGTYVRSLAGELGARLGTACHLTALRRIRVGSFHVRDAVAPPDVTARGIPARAWVEPQAALAHLGAVEVGRDEARLLAQGRRIPAGESRTGADPSGGPLALVLPGGELVAVGGVRNGLIEPGKVFLRV